MEIALATARRSPVSTRSARVPPLIAPRRYPDGLAAAGGPRFPRPTARESSDRGKAPEGGRDAAAGLEREARATVRARQGERAPAGPEQGARRGDRRADRQQGTSAVGRGAPIPAHVH